MSLNIDPIKPYMTLIRLALLCLLAGGIFVAGCNCGQASKQAEVSAAEARRDKAIADAKDNLAAANACGQALSDVSAETRLAQQRAAEWKAAADATAGRVALATAAAQAKADSAAKALQAAKVTPTCAAQMAMNLCPEIPLL